ncbi:hypothetical protein FQR65_LT00163 [Abscondita terminalis]|nr:hypothetical protein FQR65_LT00163 [Abscondita terminalis]
MKPHVTILFLITKALPLLSKQDFEECVAKTVNAVFARNESVIYVHGGNARFPFLEENPRIIIDARIRIKLAQSYKSYSHNFVLDAEDYDEFMDVLKIVITGGLWHGSLTPQGKFLLITNEKNLEKKIKFFWQCGAINLVFLIYNSKRNGTVFTIDPQAVNNNCALELREFLTVTNCFAPTRIRLPNVFRKYTNCNVTHISSVTAEKVKIRVNESIRFILELFVELFKVSLKTIARTPFDLFTFYTSYRKPLPKLPFPRRIPTMKILQIVFKNIVWINILVAYVGTSLVWWLISRALSTTSSISLAFLKAFSITLFGWAGKLVSISSMRCLFLTYVLYSIHIQTAFTSKLIEILTIPQYEPRIKTLTELGDSNLVIYVKSNVYELFFDHEEPNNELYNKIKQKLEPLSDELYMMITTEFETYTNSAALLSKNEVEILSQFYQTNFCTISDFAFVSSLERVFAAAESAYIIKTLDKLINLLMESGVLNHFLKNVVNKWTVKQKNKTDEKPVLSLQHLYFVFVFWGSGLLMSAFALICELTYFNGLRGNKNR